MFIFSAIWHFQSKQRCAIIALLWHSTQQHSPFLPTNRLSAFRLRKTARRLFDFAEEALTDQAVSSNETKDALNLAGAWRDLDFDEMMQELDRIRHETLPTPIELDL